MNFNLWSLLVAKLDHAVIVSARERVKCRGHADIAVPPKARGIYGENNNVDMADLRPCLRKNERSWSAGYQCLSMNSMLLSLCLSVLVYPCPPHLHEQVAAL